jgi:hypothetical protein
MKMAAKRRRRGRGKGKRPVGCPIVEVEWWDAASSSKWEDTHDLDPMHASAVGYLVRRVRPKKGNPGHIVLIQVFGEETTTACRFAIPLPWIKRIRKVGASRLVRWRAESAAGREARRNGESRLG